MRRVVIVGPGGAGKTVLARALGAATGLPVTELDRVFWRPGLAAMPPEEWAAVQRGLIAAEAWILDGDLGPYDVPGIRFAAADTVVFLDFSRLRCAWRAVRRSRERADFWRWLWTYRRRGRPVILALIAAQHGRPDVHVLRGPGAVRRFLDTAARPARPQ
jgi:adenylate kinase family enzyme